MQFDDDSEDDFEQMRKDWPLPPQPALENLGELLRRQLHGPGHELHFEAEADKTIRLPEVNDFPPFRYFQMHIRPRRRGFLAHNWLLLGVHLYLLICGAANNVFFLDLAHTMVWLRVTTIVFGLIGIAVAMHGFWMQKQMAKPLILRHAWIVGALVCASAVLNTLFLIMQVNGVFGSPCTDRRESKCPRAMIHLFFFLGLLAWSFADMLVLANARRFYRAFVKIEARFLSYAKSSSNQE